MGIDFIYKEGRLVRIGGFHQDVKSLVEKSGIFEFVKEVEENGCYLAKIFYKGQYVDRKAFFPAHWTCDQVMNALCEAYNSVDKKMASLILEKNGKYKIEGITKEGIKIRMYITKKGHMVTAYPILI